MTTTLRIGSLHLDNNLILAPMAGITNHPMRIVARECGAGLCFTEMVSVNGLVRDGEKSFDLLAGSPEDRPLGLQIFGDDPGLMAEGAVLAAPYGDLIDINMGCPVRKVVGSGAGSALMRDPARVREIVRQVRKAVSLPLTVKIRSGWTADEENFLEIARIAEEEGCDAVTLHPRTRAQMFDGTADWSKLALLKRSISIPVIGSGDLFTPGDVVAMLDKTGCDGVMVARGALGNPWIFREALALLEGGEPQPPTRGERLTAALKHMELFITEKGERTALLEMRKHVSWYARGLAGASRFRNEVNRLEGKEALVEVMTSFFGAEGYDGQRA